MFFLTTWTIISIAAAIVAASNIKLRAEVLRVIVFALLLQPLLSDFLELSKSSYLFGYEFVYPTAYLYLLYFFFLYFFYMLWLYGANSSFSLVFLVLLLSGIFSLNILVASRDLYIIFFSAELFTLVSYYLLLWSGLPVGVRSYGFGYAKAIIKYFILSCLLTSILFFLIAYIGVTFHTTNLDSLYYYTVNTKSWAIGLFFSIILFKLGVFPFYFIYVDLYDHISWRAFFFFNYISKLFYLMLLVTFYNYCFVHIDTTIVMTVALFTILVGAVGVYNSIGLRRLLVYSSLYNLGSALILIVLDAAPVACSYILVYSFLSSFLVFSFIYFEKVRRMELNRIYHLSLRLYGCYAGYFSTIFFALSGIPPLSFFWFKFTFFKIAYQDLNNFVIIFLVLTSVLITVAYFRIIKFLLYETGYSYFNFNRVLLAFFYLVLVLTNFTLSYNDLIHLFTELQS